MKKKLILFFSFIGCCIWSTRGACLSDDSLFFAQKKGLLTATWKEPFSYNSIKSNHAPLGPYLGNGDVGVVAFTSDNSQTLKISKVDFVTDGWNDWAGSGPAALPVGGVSITVNSSVYSGFTSVNYPDTTAFNYQMDQLAAELRMRTATAQPVQMTSWMGSSENVIVTELTTTSKEAVSVSVNTYADSQSEHYATTADLQGDLQLVTRQTKREGVRWISQAGIATKIIGTKASNEKLSDSMVRSTFRLMPSDTVLVVTYVSGGGMDNNARLSEATEKLLSWNEKEIALLKAEREAWWKEMWTRSYVETYDDLLNRHYLSSIYLLASAYNEHSPVCGGMYGVWNMDDKMMYHGDIHLNYNSQAGFYSAFSANRPEIALPFYKTIERLIPEGKRRAKEEMGVMHPSWKGKSCRGLLFPVGALGIGVFYNYYWQQTSNAPFNVPLYSWYYEYTGNLEFLRDKAYPYIKLCGDFYEDYLQKESYGDSYRYTIQTGGHENSWDLNPPSDLAFVEQTFSLLLKYSEMLGVDKSRRKKWKDILTHLPEYKVIMPTKEPNEGLPVYAKNEEGWDLPSHAVQMLPVYPCEVLHLRSDSTALQIARNTIYYYEVSQKGFTETMNELGLSAFIMGARVGFSPDLLIDNMRTLIKTAKPNFLIVDGHHCTEKTAVIETINSMMLQTVDGIIHLFPCWPEKPGAFVRLRAKGAFLVSADYDGKSVSDVSLYSEKGGVCKLKNPWAGKALRIQSDGKMVPAKNKEGVYVFNTRKGKTYIIGHE